MPQYLHIVSFDVPFPANYGGVIDVYYKLVWLKKSGVKVYLHCFNYGRKQSPELEQLCERVFYYERRTGILSNLSFLPYNVKSRISGDLTKNLLADNHPILFEVLHTCYLMQDKRFQNRKKIYRHSNIEHHYYRDLSKSERNILKKMYLKIEAFKLKRFEAILKYADLILAVNKADTEYFEKKYPNARSLYLPSFHPNAGIQINKGRGDYIFFHGNLGVSENYEAAAWLITEVFSKLDFKCVIAGLNPPDFLSRLVENQPNITLLANPDEKQMNDLLRNAQINMLFTAQPTGLKLKLLNVMYQGRFILCNAHMVAGTGIIENESLFICESAQQFIEKSRAVIDKVFSENLIAARSGQVVNFDNEKNGVKLIESVFQM